MVPFGVEFVSEAVSFGASGGRFGPRRGGGDLDRSQPPVDGAQTLGRPGPTVLAPVEKGGGHAARRTAAGCGQKGDHP